MSLASDHSIRADRSNWRTSPFNKCAFRNVGEIIPVAEIASGSDIAPLPVELQSFDHLRVPSGRGETLSLRDVLKATETDGFVILHDGRIVCEYYDHGTTAETQHIVMSATKSVTGLIAGILRGRGVLDPDVRVSSYVPEIAATAYRDATVRHLLDMRSGIILNARELRAYAVASNWEALAPDETGFGLHTFFRTMTAPHQPHGGVFKYVSANTDLLGWVIERASGKRFAALVSELLWKPMGAERSAFITVDCNGAPRCTGGFCTTVRDLARLGQLIVADGQRRSANIIPRELLADIAENGDRNAWKNGEFAAYFGGRTMSYRNSWYVVHDAPKLLFAMGIHGQNLFVDRANRIVIAKVSSQDDPIDYQATTLTHRAVAEVRRCLG